MWLAAARRFFTLLGVLVGAVFLCAVSVGLLLGTSLNRTIAESAIFLVLGIVLIVIGLAIDSRYRLV